MGPLLVHFGLIFSFFPNLVLSLLGKTVTRLSEFILLWSARFLCEGPVETVFLSPRLRPFFSPPPRIVPVMHSSGLSVLPLFSPMARECFSIPHVLFAVLAKLMALSKNLQICFFCRPGLILFSCFSERPPTSCLCAPHGIFVPSLA